MTNKARLTFRDYVVVSVSVLFFMVPPSMGANQATVQIKGQVKAVCNVDVPTTVVIPDINFDDLKPGISLTDKSAIVTVKGECSGGVKIKYKISVPSRETFPGCIGTTPRILALCLKIDDKVLQFDSDGITIDNAPKEFSIRIDPTGVPDIKKVSEYTSSFTIKIEPM